MIVPMLVYRSIKTDDYEAVQTFLADNGWAARVSDVERFRAMLDGADRTVVALDEGRVVGFARALCDGVSNGYISMVAVAEDLRRQGIGRHLVEHLTQEDIRGSITWVLRAGRDSRGFWERLGFAASDIAMERVRRG
jgi:ribosomal protein S18 acetylase RimI-like enzyme